MASKLELENENLVLTGQPTAETLHVRTFRRCRFRGGVNLHLLVWDHGLSFEQCVFENGLDLSGARLTDKLSMTDCLLVQGRHHPLIDDTAQPFSFDDLSADGVQIDGLWSTGSLSASRVRIDGAVQLFRVTALGRINLTGLAAQSLHLSHTHTKEDIELQKCVIKQSVDFQDVRAGVRRAGENVETDSSIGLYGAVIKFNSVEFRGVTLTGDLSANFLRVGTGFFLEPDALNTIGGSIKLGGANLPKGLRIRNTHVGKSIEAKGVATAEVRILGGRLQDFKTSPDLTAAEIDRRLQELFKASPGLTVAEFRRRWQEFKTSPDLTVAEIDRRLQELFKASPHLTVAEFRRQELFKTSPDRTVAEIDRRLQELFKASPDLTVAEISHRRQELKTSPDLTVAEIDRRLQESFKASPGLTVAEFRRRRQELFKTSPDLSVAEIDRRLQESFKASPDLSVAETDRRLQELFKASPDLTVAEISRRRQEFKTSPDLTVGEM